MLIAFKISNFLSFDVPIEFIMRAGTVRELSHHLIKGKGRNDVDILKAAIVYGANASGKSNFIKAIDFAKNVIINGLTKTATENKHFRLDITNIDKPTQFEFEFRHNGKMYAYGVVLSLTDRKIKEELLFELKSTTDKPVFERKVLYNGKSEIELGLKLDTEGKRRFEVYIKDIKDTQLFLSEINDKNIDDIRNIQSFIDAFDWFKNNLVIIYPDTKLKGLSFVGNNEEMKNAFCTFLAKFKTGIQAVETIEQDIDDKFPTEFQEKVLNDLNEKGVQGITLSYGKNTYTFSKNKDGELKLYKLNTMRHVKNSTEMVSFEVEEESDGTRRMMDFIPALIGLAKTESTYLIDEIDRSLHPEMTQKLLEVFFQHTQGIESQLIATTHESGLLDLSLLRRDEIWFVEKDQDGASKMYSLEQFRPRHDKEVRKAYLQGRFGATPVIVGIRVQEINSLDEFQKTEQDAKRKKRSQQAQI
jgi:AAA15 family ATPase/GTPase